MYFNHYVYGNIRIEKGELHTGKDPETSLDVPLFELNYI